MRRGAFLVSLVGGLVLAMPSVARAGGFEIGTDNGAISVARGGASTALAPDMSAIYTNVAGAADIPGRSDIYIGTNLTMRHLSFDRTGFGSTEDETPIFAGPMLAAAIRVHELVTVILGANGPTAVGWGNFDEGTADDPGPGRYDLTHMNLLYVWPSIGVAFQVPRLETLRIGAVFQPGFMNMSFTSFANLALPDNPDTDVRTDVALWAPFVPAGQLGILYRVWRLEMGAQVRLAGNSIRAEGDLTATQDPYGTLGEPNERPTVRTFFDLGWPIAVARFGVRYFHPRRDNEDELLAHRREWFDIEVDFVYENNEQMDEFVVTAQEPVSIEGLGPEPTDVELPPMRIPHNWKDTFSVRLGGSVNLLDGDLSLSLGGHWESGAVPNELTRLDFLSWTRIGVAFGITYRYRWFEITAAYQHIFMPSRDVAEDEAQAFALRATARGGTFENSPINAGHFEASYDVLSVSLNFRL